MAPAQIKSRSLPDQLLHENATWKRVLGFLTEENINLKNRLSEILQNKADCDKSFLEQVEYFQNSFLKQDEVLGFLRIEVGDQENSLLPANFPGTAEQLKEIQKKQKKLRQEFESAELLFNKLKFEFNSYLSTIL